MKAVVRSVMAIVLGTLASVMIIFACERVSSFLYPAPAEIDRDKFQEAIAAYISSLPPSAFFFLLAGWALGTFAGAALAARISTVARVAHGLTIGVIMQEAAVVTMRNFPHPEWVWYVALGLFVAAAYAGSMYAVSIETPVKPTTPQV